LCIYEEQKKKAHIEEIIDEESEFIDDLDDTETEPIDGVYF